MVIYVNLMRPETNYNRVMAIAKLVNEYELGKEEIKLLLSPNIFGNGSVDKIFKAAEELKVIKIKENGKVKLIIDKEVLNDGVRFKNHVRNKLIKTDDQYLELSKLILSKYEFAKKNISAQAVANELAYENESGKNLKESILGWRDWAVNLGLGYHVKNSFFIGTPFVVVDQFIERKYLTGPKVTKKTIRINEFVLEMLIDIPELEELIDNKKIKVNLAMSLKYLEKQKKIKINYVVDTTESYYELKNSDGSIQKVSEIIVGMEVRNG